ncbi:hypothetical protein K435DRAFT_859492 [Dendrothele bispora CBS 962.96]|uniref:Uncharacterized protein n=1 Tax=Dendrothele bispora (strain CBS 962.96) TaxID=1314807 RepID=A0A4S8M0E8_DENBC|nr:hypothetical protein K435DRAFT_859492 [Dendrothele bispora CBS 962.96]
MAVEEQVSHGDDVQVDAGGDRDDGVGSYRNGNRPFSSCLREWRRDHRHDLSREEKDFKQDPFKRHLTKPKNHLNNLKARQGADDYGDPQDEDYFANSLHTSHNLPHNHYMAKYNNPGLSLSWFYVSSFHFYPASQVIFSAYLASTIVYLAYADLVVNAEDPDLVPNHPIPYSCPAETPHRTRTSSS